jgi:hypothetical protein
MAWLRWSNGGPIAWDEEEAGTPMPDVDDLWAEIAMITSGDVPTMSMKRRATKRPKSRAKRNIPRSSRFPQGPYDDPTRRAATQAIQYVAGIDYADGNTPTTNAITLARLKKRGVWEDVLILGEDGAIKVYNSDLKALVRRAAPLIKWLNATVKKRRER